MNDYDWKEDPPKKTPYLIFLDENNFSYVRKITPLGTLTNSIEGDISCMDCGCVISIPTIHVNACAGKGKKND